MLRELLRSTLYSSSRPFSSSATRRSSFSTLTISLLPVLRDERPKSLFTLSIINLEKLSHTERKRQVDCASLCSKFIVVVPRRRIGAGGGGAGLAVRIPKILWKKLRGRCGVWQREQARATRAPAHASPCPQHPLPVPHPAMHP